MPYPEGEDPSTLTVPGCYAIPTTSKNKEAAFAAAVCMAENQYTCLLYTSYSDIPDNNWKQAIVPVGAIVLDNDNGTAPGLILEKGGKTAILLPGPPGELKPLFEKQAAPYLKKKQPEAIVSQMVKTVSYTHLDVYKRQIPVRRRFT